MYNFFGGQPGAVVLRLILISFVVGVLLHFLGVSPYDIIDGLHRLISRIYNLGFEAFEWLFRYLLLGAVVVFPIWLIARIWKVATEARTPAKKSTGPDPKT